MIGHCYGERVSMSFANLPPAIATFLRALQAGDGPGVLAVFTKAAVLVDQGREYRGDAIKQWYGRVVRRAGATAHPINLARHGYETTLTVMVRGNDEVGGAGPAELDWLFTIEGGKIAGLTITKARSIDLPIPIAAYVLATNTFDLEALMATFADDALVNDQLCEY